ncbi:hypothetical protein NKT34_06345 [Paenibacillus polysaccharolyticus]|uniref:hypothetical protein n=1 Tax=Paenibacillus polysaccharolyticus TaxID=582692 RepID=UPI00209D8DCF|nr:hypothetical protein [Paenibacillus polysaccharolyticus]MCP1132900.1 hypothetical protein [Paenibacillus polysaccharolyticus]
MGIDNQGIEDKEKVIFKFGPYEMIMGRIELNKITRKFAISLIELHLNLNVNKNLDWLCAFQGFFTSAEAFQR